LSKGVRAIAWDALQTALPGLKLSDARLVSDPLEPLPIGVAVEVGGDIVVEIGADEVTAMVAVDDPALDPCPLDGDDLHGDVVAWLDSQVVPYLNERRLELGNQLRFLRRVLGLGQ